MQQITEDKRDQSLDIMKGIGLNVKLQQLLNIFTAINCKPAFIYNIVLWFLPYLFMAELLYSK